jgi:hypothetical protein
MRVLSGGREREVRVALSGATKLVPVHIGQRPPSYFILGGLVFTPVTVPLLRSEYGKVRCGAALRALRACVFGRVWVGAWACLWCMCGIRGRADKRGARMCRTLPPPPRPSPPAMLTAGV